MCRSIVKIKREDEMKNKRDITISVTLTKNEHDALKKLAESHDRTLSALVRLLIRDVLFLHNNPSQSSTQASLQNVPDFQHPVEVGPSSFPE